MRTPVRALRATTPFSEKPFTQILPLASQRPTSTLALGLMAPAVSTRQPPMLVLARLPQIGISASSTRNSTATKHFKRECRRRSCPQFGTEMSGSNGGVAADGIRTAHGGVSGALTFALADACLPGA